MEQHHDPTPCTEVVLQPGYAVLKDSFGQTQFLLIPTARVSGIKDPAILAPDAPNYWEAAWQARGFVEQRLGHPLPKDAISLAINSVYGRTQNQLHIHVDCIRIDVERALTLHAGDIGAHWAPFPEPLAGYPYRAMRITEPDLASVNPFRLLADSVPPDEMRLHTLVVAAMAFNGRPGFVLLDGRADLATGDRGSGEELQDHECVIGRE